jgi:hypothetical protein
MAANLPSEHSCSESIGKEVASVAEEAEEERVPRIKPATGGQMIVINPPHHPGWPGPIGPSTEMDCFYEGREYSPGSTVNMPGPRGPRLMMCDRGGSGVWLPYQD